MATEKPKRGRPPKLIPPIHAPFEAVIKALVQSVNQANDG